METRNYLDPEPQSHAIEKYSEGIGQLRDHEQKLHIDPSIPQVSMQTYRRTPFHLRKQQLMSFYKICRAQPSSELTSQLAANNNEHDDHLNAFFARLKGPTVNPAKCRYRQESLLFY